jgi:hypothetical protein
VKQRITTALAAAALAVGLVTTSATPAAASSSWPVPWDGTIVEFVNKMPSSWSTAVNDGINWLDQYTGSDLRVVTGSCHANVRRCVTIVNARLKGGEKENSTGWSEGTTITIDVWKTENVSPWKGHFDGASKKYLIAHEAGHQRFQNHTSDCKNFMEPRWKCDGRVPYLWTNDAQKKSLKTY